MRRIGMILISLLVLLPGLAHSAGGVELALAGLDGKEHKLSDYRGKWVVVNYWATWCPPCVEEMPELVFFHDQHVGKDALVIGINYEDASEQTVRDFLDEHFVSYPIWLAEPGSFSPLGKIQGLPTTFIVSPSGEVVHRKVGRVDLDYLNRIITAAKSMQ